MLGGKLLDPVLLAGRDEHAPEPLSLVQRLTDERIETPDVAVHAAPAEVDSLRRPRGRFADDVEAHQRSERAEECVDVDQACRRAVRQFAAFLLLETEPLDLDRVALRRCGEAIATAVEEHDRRVEVIEQRRRRFRPEIREEQVDAVVVDARFEQARITVPLLADVVAKRARVERLHSRDRPRHRSRTQVEFARRPDLGDLELSDRFLRRVVEHTKVIDVVAEPLGAPWTLAIDTEDVDDAAAHREVAGGRHRALPPIAKFNEARDELVTREPVPALDLGHARADHFGGERRSEQPARRRHHEQRLGTRVQAHERCQAGSRHLL